MKISKNLVEAWNRRGWVVREEVKVDAGTRITVMNATYKITYLSTMTNHSHSYLALCVRDLYKEREYTSSRYFKKFLPLLDKVDKEVFNKNRLDLELDFYWETEGKNHHDTFEEFKVDYLAWKERVENERTGQLENMSYWN